MIPDPALLPMGAQLPAGLPAVFGAVQGGGGGALVPWWLAVPLASVALLATAAHIIALREAPPGRIPESRRRIRIATGWVIMPAIPLSAYAFGIASPDRPGVFAIVWMAVVGLLGAIVLLALLDAFNTVRLHRDESRRLREELRRPLRDPDDARP